MPVRRFLFVVLFPLLAAAAGRETDHNIHGWYAYFGDHPVSRSKWGVHLESQWRRHDLAATGQQFLLRPGVNYQATRALMLTAGYAFARSHTYSDFAVPAPATNEHRSWQQAWFRYGSESVRWSTRIRFENRFIGVNNPPGQTSYRFENRIRAWQQVTAPITPRLYLTAYDEIWLYVKPYVSKSVFDQNRAYGGIGFHLKPDLRLEVAYMNQTLLQRSGAALELNHTLVVSLFSSAPFLRR